MKKILFMMPTVFNHGGEQRTVTNLCNSLIENGYEVNLVLFDKTFPINHSLYGLSKDIKIHFVDNYYGFFHRFCRKIRNLNSTYGFLKPFNILNKFLMKNSFPFFEITNIIEDVSPNYVVGVASDFSLLCYFLNKRFKNIKFIGWQHSCHKAYFNTKGRRHYHEKKLVSKMYKSLYKYVVLTKNDKIMLKKELGLESIVIYNMKSFSSNLKSNLHSHKIMSAGRMDKIKGFDLLIEAFYKFNNLYKDNDWTLDIFGDGFEKENIEKMICDYNLSNKVYIHNFTNNIIDEYKNHSIYIMPSRWEGFPLTIGECFEMNLPMLCFNIDVVKEFITNKKDGVFVESFDTDELAKELYNLVINIDERKRIAKNENIKIALLSEESIIEKWNKIFEK